MLLPVVEDPAAGARGPGRALLLPGTLAAFGLFWIWLATAVHTLPVIGGEIDGYVARAATMLDGKLIGDGLHPFGLSVAIAALGWFGLDLFVAGKVVGVLSGLLLLGATYLLARTWVGPVAAVLTMVAVGASEHVLVGAVQACSDVPAAALLAVGLLAWTRSATSERPRARGLIVGGLALGLAVFVRTPSMAYAPAFLPLVVGVAFGEAVRRASWALLGGAIGIAPHLATMWLSAQKLGQNSSQIVWKYRFAHDDHGFFRHGIEPQPVSWGELAEWMGIGALDWVRYVTGQIAAPWCPPGWPWVAVVASVALTLAMVLPVLLRRRAPSVPALAGSAFCVALCLFSFPEQRLTLPILAPAIVLATLGWLLPRGPLRRLPTTLAALLALGALANVPRALTTFEHLHARAEMQVARELIAEHGPWVSIASPVVGVEPGLPCVFHCYSPLPQVPGAPPTQWGRLLANASARSASFVVVGRRSHPAVHAEMARVEPPAGYERLRSGDVLLFARTAAPAWLAAATVDADAAELRLAIRLAADVDPATVAGVGFLAQSAQQPEWVPIVLPPTGDGGYALALPVEGMRAGGRWRFVPGLLTWSGEWQRGTPIDWQAADATGR